MVEATSLLGLDDVIDERARRAIMAILYVEDSSFRYLREKTGLTAGNLGAHLRVLEQAEYVQVKKSFLGRRPHSSYRMTEKGRRAFREYIAKLEKALPPRL
jgi:DNA-binding MarR family transcriptional regulator